MRWAGFLAVWAGLYAVGCVVFLAVAIDRPVGAGPLILAWLLTVGVYLLDRTGPWPALPDRGDLSSVPARVRFLRRRVPYIRWVALVVLVASVALSLGRGLLVLIMVPAAVIGMTVYGHAPRKGRLKDRLFIKNIAVASGFAAMATALVIDPIRVDGTIALCVGALWLHVLASAVLCDLDDASSDARHGTRTIPNTFGVPVTWWTAECLTVAAGVLVLVSRGTAGIPLVVTPWIAVAALHLCRPQRVRDLVDLTFPLAVLCAFLASAL